MISAITGTGLMRGQGTISCSVQFWQSEQDIVLRVAVSQLLIDRVSEAKCHADNKLAVERYYSQRWRTYSIVVQN